MRSRCNLAITASTGIAVLQFSDGQTVHRWSGLGDGHLPRDTICRNIMTDNSNVQIKNRIQQTDALILDEIGMLSAQNFET